MGIDVSPKKVVSFNATHEQRVVTDPARRCPTAVAGPVQVTSLFARKRARQDSDDGNPLIYALKGKFGYKIAYGDFREIYNCASLILPKALEGKVFDAVVPLPSSSPIARILATRVVRARAGSEMIDCLEKATIGDVLADLPAPDAVPQRFRDEYTTMLNKLQRANPSSVIEMKQIPLRIRNHLSPVVARATAGACAGRSILLVDDIFGTGTSLQSAALALSVHQPASVAGLTLLGRLS